MKLIFFIFASNLSLLASFQSFRHIYTRNFIDKRPSLCVSDSSEGITDESLKLEALSLLDCLTSPRDEDDIEYDVMKDIRRDKLLELNDYQDLKLQLRSRGLRTSGDKLEMITRLLLHIIDPTVTFNEMY